MMLQNGESDSPEVARDTSVRTSGVLEEGPRGDDVRLSGELNDITGDTQQYSSPSPRDQATPDKYSSMCRVSLYGVIRESDSQYGDSNPTWSETSLGEESGRRKRRRQQTATQRRAANTRERRRMCHLNQAFILLKKHLPNARDKNRLSRIQTLRAAISYIQYLIVESKDTKHT